MIDIEKRKKEITVMLDELELDIKTLQDDILRLKTDIANVDENTNLKKFDEEHNLERNLKYIRLYWLCKGTSLEDSDYCPNCGANWNVG